MFNLMIILLSTINSEPKDTNNYKIAKYIIENIRSLEECTLTQLAKQCYVSNSSISRFCRDIGLKDFNALKNQVARFPIEHKQAENKFEFKSFDSSSIYTSYILSVMDNLHHLSTQKIDKEIEMLANDVFKYKKVAAFGYMQSENIALNLQYDLQTNGKVVFTCIKFIDQADYMNTSDDETLIIIFSESGTYFDRVFPRTHPFKPTKKKPKIYMVTCHPTIQEPYVDHYIRYQTRKDFACHPYPLLIIADLISIHYAHLLHNTL